MWHYDRSEEAGLVPFKTQDEHFELFCMVLERGFAIHTGQTDRLVVEFRLSDTGSRRYLPRISPKGGISFRIPEACLKPSDLYLYYDPSSDADIPELAYFSPAASVFIPYDYENENLLEQGQEKIVLPVVKLSTLKGLHYIKDVACLQMFEPNFDRLYKADQALAEQVKGVLARKMARFVEFSHPWAQANHAEKVALDYLSSHAPKQKTPKAQEQGFVDPDSPFLNWD